MQHWLSGYANWYAKRNSRTGHLFQGRYKALLVEDAGYFWSLSRYIHLNPCRGAKPLADAPETWPHSNYGGYARRASRVDWIVYDDLHRYWQGQNGGKSPQAAYRKCSSWAGRNEQSPQRSMARLGIGFRRVHQTHAGFGGIATLERSLGLKTENQAWPCEALAKLLQRQDCRAQLLSSFSVRWRMRSCRRKAAVLTLWETAGIFITASKSCAAFSTSLMAEYASARL